MGASAATGIPWSFTAHRYDVVLNNLLTEKLRSARFGRFIADEMLAIARRFVAPDALARAVVLHMGVRSHLVRTWSSASAPCLSYSAQRDWYR